MVYRTDLRRLSGYKYVFGTSSPEVFVIRLTAKLAFVPMTAAEFTIRVGDVASVNKAMSELELPMNIPMQCIKNGSLERAKQELDQWAWDHGFSKGLGCGYISSKK